MSVLIKNLDKNIVNINDEIMKDDSGDQLNNKIIYYKSILTNDSHKLTPEDTMDRWDFAKRFKGSNGKMEVTEKEFKLLRDLIPVSFAVQIAAQAIKNLDECKAEQLQKDKESKK